MMLRLISIFFLGASGFGSIFAMESGLPIPSEKQKEYEHASHSAPTRIFSLPELPQLQLKKDQKSDHQKNLFLAIETNNIFLFNASVEKIKDINGSTALYQAIDNGLVDRVLSLLAQGVDPNGLINEQGYTPLGYAKKLGKKNFVDYFVKIRAAIEHTPLMYAIKREFCSEDIINILVSHPNIMINARSASNNTALHYAVWFNKQDIALLLCRKGANLLAFNNEKKIPGLYAHDQNFKDLLYECSLAFINKRPISPVLRNAKKLNQSCGF